MAASTGMIHVRIDDEIKAQASETLEAMGLSVSEAIRLFLHRVVSEQALPFELKVPNAKTRTAMAEAEKIAKSRKARFKSGETLIKEIEKASR